VLDRGTGSITHGSVNDLPGYLREGDALTLNDSRVIPARVHGRRADTGGKVEMLFLEDQDNGTWLAQYKASRPARNGLRIAAGESGEILTVVQVMPQGRVLVKAEGESQVASILEKEGSAPLPPYIGRGSNDPRLRTLDRERYQTVYARHPGAVAAPTAGLHLTRRMLSEVEAKGVKLAFVTLHVGPGTFLPVRAEHVEMHRMESERYEVSEAAAAAINAAKEQGGRVIAVGTTSVRTLESVAGTDGSVGARRGRTELFIYPPYRFRVVDAMLTNFHLPGSTLLMMISAFAGYDLLMEAYREAVSRKYRFYSYGDCMLIT
jgi:S-adenosylmethionine:tRNA ribosyltransferase-isomerase